jgi:beta-lactam-binding protein with PASTA domain
MAIVPDLIGATEEQARNLLGNAGLRVGQVTRSVASARPFTVFKQDYDARTQVTAGTAVGFVVAEPIPPDRSGRGGTVPPPVKMAIVPDLSGAAEERARELLVNAGLQVGEVTKGEANTKPFTVFKQDYPAGAQVTAGTAVGFVLAVPITVEVPPVVGSTQGTAVAILRKFGLRPGTIKDEQSRLPKDQVLTQGIPAGTKVPAGSAVDLTIAVPITRAVPALRQLLESDAVAVLKKLELAVGDVTTEESRELPGRVLSQRPAAGTIVEIGTRVSFVVATTTTVEVPPLVNRPAIDAVALLKKLGLNAGNVTSEESRRSPDTVLSQVPVAGTRVAIGTTVAFVIARPVTIPVPDVVSMQEADARKELISKQLAIGSVNAVEARVATGSVLRQSIAAGRRVTVGTPIDLVTAKRVTVLVPKIAGLKEDAARAALVAAELRPGVQYQESPAEPGTVLTQAIDPDTRVPIETVVDLVVSAVETVPVPSVVGIAKDEARQRLLAGRLAAGSETVRPVRSESRDIVLAQSIEAGVRIPIGTAIVLTVSTPEMVEVPRVVDLPRTDAFTAIASAGLKVGQVSRGLSFTRAGGTIVGQGLNPGLRVEFGTALAVDEALPRIIWAGPATGLLAAAGLLEQRRRRKKKVPDRPPSETAKPVPPLDVSARANIHVGEASVRTDDAQVIRVELRISPRAGPASQDITAESGTIIKDERRVTTDQSANEEGTS